MLILQEHPEEPERKRSNNTTSDVEDSDDDNATGNMADIDFNNDNWAEQWAAQNALRIERDSPSAETGTEGTLKPSRAQMGMLLGCGMQLKAIKALTFKTQKGMSNFVGTKITARDRFREANANQYPISGGCCALPVHVLLIDSCCGVAAALTYRGGPAATDGACVNQGMACTTPSTMQMSVPST